MIRLAKLVAALAALVALIATPPVLLVRLVGNPWPAEGVDLQAPLTDGAIIGLLAVIVWVLWAQVVWCVVVEATAAVTADRVVPPAGFTLGVQRQLVRRLVSVIVLATVAAPVLASAAPGWTAPATIDPTTVATTSATASTGAGTAGSVAAPVAGVLDQGRPGDSPAATALPDPPRRPAQDLDRKTGHLAGVPEDQTTPTSGAVAPTGSTVTVMRLDSLWSIAERTLGDGERWSEIADLNHGRTMTDGAVFDSADHIRPGWQLRVPTPSHLGAGPPAADPVSPSHIQVQPGDTLSQLAQDHLGDADRARQIFVASVEITQPGGVHLSDPDVIDVGWSLDLGNETTAPRDTTTPTRRAQRLDRAPEQPTGRSSDKHTDRHPAQRNNPNTTPATPRAVPTPQPTAGPDLEPGPPVVSPSASSTAGVDGRQDVESDGTRQDGDAERDSGADHPAWMLLGLTGSGAVLAGGLLLGLRSRRRTQARTRLPGYGLPRTPDGLIAVEKSVWVNHDNAAISTALDLALRQLAAQAAQDRHPMPAVAAIELGPDRTATLHLSAPGRLPSTWTQVDDTGSAWRTALKPDDPTAGDGDGDEDEALDAVDPPYPLLIGIGATTGARAGDADTGQRRWLINLEELAHVRITGDPERAADLARYVVAEAAVNPWAGQATVTCLGLDHAFAGIEDSRVETRPASDARAVLASTLRHISSTMARSRDLDADPATGRTGQVDEDTWPALLLCVDEQIDPDLLDSLTSQLDPARPRAGTAVVRLDRGDRPGGDGGVVLDVSAEGVVSLPAFGLGLDAARLTDQESLGCVELLQACEATDAVAIPVDEDAVGEWARFADRTGALRRDLTRSRRNPTHDPPHGQPDVEPDIQPDDQARGGSLLPEPDEHYVQRAAITADDLEVLAPAVPRDVGTAALASDPDLDADLSDWWDRSCRRPRLTLLGPVAARTHGKALAKRKPYFTEMLTFLVLRRRHGVRPADLADAFNIEARKARIYANTIRDWLGPVDGTEDLYLPHADKSPAAADTGVAVYQIDHRLLVDAELFRRLRVRGQANGPDGIGDLDAALRLVAGRPFDNLRPGGWSWLLDGEREDHYASAAVADVSLIAVTHHLATGDLAAARAAAERGVLGAPDETAARISLARVLAEEGNTQEADAMLRSSVFDHDDDGLGPTDCPPREVAVTRAPRAVG